MGIPHHLPFIQTAFFHYLNTSFPHLASGTKSVLYNACTDNLLHIFFRIQAGGRILKNDLHFLPEGCHGTGVQIFPLVCIKYLLSFKYYPAS